MDRRGSRSRSGLVLVAAIVNALLFYWLVIFPRELRRWQRHARAIPSPELRCHALGTLDEEHLSAEGTAAFAILTRLRGRKHVVRLCVAFEVMYDSLDRLAEERVRRAREQPLASPGAS